MCKLRKVSNREPQNLRHSRRVALSLTSDWNKQPMKLRCIAFNLLLSLLLLLCKEKITTNVSYTMNRKAKNNKNSWTIAKKTEKTAQCAQYMGALKSFETPHYAPATFPEICNGLLLWSILRMCVQNLKFVALPVPEIIGGTQKIWAVPGYAHVHFLPKFWRAFVRIDPLNIPAKFEVRSFIRSWDNRGFSKNLGSPCIRPRSIFSQIFNWLLFAWTIWMYLPNLTFYTLPIPEIIGDTSKNWGVPGFAHAPYSPKFLKGFCSHGPYEYTCQVWSS